MKVFFDTNVYIAEALLGEAAEALLSATSSRDFPKVHQGAWQGISPSLIYQTRPH